MSDYNPTKNYGSPDLRPETIVGFDPDIVESASGGEFSKEAPYTGYDDIAGNFDSLSQIADDGPDLPDGYVSASERYDPGAPVEPSVAYDPAQEARGTVAEIPVVQRVVDRHGRSMTVEQANRLDDEKVRQGLSRRPMRDVGPNPATPNRPVARVAARRAPDSATAAQRLASARSAPPPAITTKSLPDAEGPVIEHGGGNTYIQQSYSYVPPEEANASEPFEGEMAFFEEDFESPTAYCDVYILGPYSFYLRTLSLDFVKWDATFVNRLAQELNMPVEEVKKETFRADPEKAAKADRMTLHRYTAALEKGLLYWEGPRPCTEATRKTMLMPLRAKIYARLMLLSKYGIGDADLSARSSARS